MKPVSPSRLACDALGLPPIGERATALAHCSMCGFDIHPGDIHTRIEFGQSFMDDIDLAARSGVACGYCSVLKQVDPLRATQRGVFTKDAAYSLAKDSDRAWLFLTPPEPPFVAVLSDSMQQHLVWRTPVTMHKDLIVVRLGGRILRIRRPVLLEAVQAAEAYMLSDERNMQSATPARHPFVFLDREMGDLAHGALRSEHVGRVPDILLRLTPGELWAMSALSKRERAAPVMPNLITV